MQGCARRRNSKRRAFSNLRLDALSLRPPRIALSLAVCCVLLRRVSKKNEHVNKHGVMRTVIKTGNHACPPPHEPPPTIRRRTRCGNTLRTTSRLAPCFTLPSISAEQTAGPAKTGKRMSVPFPSFRRPSWLLFTTAEAAFVLLTTFKL